MRIAVLAGIAATAAAAPGSASAAIDFQPCATPAGVQCATIEVPIDRAGRVPGTLPLLVHRIPATRPSRKPPLVVLAGGPGQSNTDLSPQLLTQASRVATDRDAITFAVRGTGPSRIDCPEIQSENADADAVAACAERLGPARNYFTTRDNAEDLESVRTAIEAPKLTIFAQSYGTRFAYEYAVRHPAAVESLVLDSTLSPESLADPFATASFKAAPGIARAACSGGACRGMTRDLFGDIAALFDRLNKKPIEGLTYDASGRRVKVTITGVGAAALLPQIDLDRNLRAELPRAIAGAKRGDNAALARLLTPAAEGPPRDSRPDDNNTLNLATNCEELIWPFDRTASRDDRVTQARDALSRTPASVFAPFGPDIAFGLSQVSTCAGWPMLPERPDVGVGSPPDVPVLFVTGRFDLRTPASFTRATARRFPHAEILTVPAGGHSSFGSDPSACTRKAMRAFLLGDEVERCRRIADPFAPRPLAPTTTPRTPRQAVSAAVLTVGDVLNQADVASGFRPDRKDETRGGGLRGGRWSLGRAGAVLTGAVFVPGVAVSGSVPRRGTVVLKLSGRVEGIVRFTAGGRVSGRVNGVEISGTARLPRRSPFELARSARDAALERQQPGV